MKRIFTAIVLLLQANLYAQQIFPVTDSMPATVEGLKAGYDITGASEKEVGDKGNFSRFKIHFYITNISTEAKLILYKPNSSFFGGSASPELVKFKCSNATGARFTNKEATLSAKPCVIDALVDEPDAASGKTVQKKKPANIGYWIKPGESISSNTIMIVPLNEKPNVTVTYFPNTGTMGATAINNDNNSNNSQYANQPSQNFIRIKNFASNNYLHNQNGPIACTTIDFNWWSAQWEMVAVSGTNYYQIRNRWKNNFISTDNASMLSENGQSANSMWFVEEIGNTHTYSIKNSANNSSLVFQNGVLKTMTVFGTQPFAQWIVEQ